MLSASLNKTFPSFLHFSASGRYSVQLRTGTDVRQKPVAGCLRQELRRQRRESDVQFHGLQRRQGAVLFGRRAAENDG